MILFWPIRTAPRCEHEFEEIKKKLVFTGKTIPQEHRNANDPEAYHIHVFKCAGCGVIRKLLGNKFAYRKVSA